ncbi:MAG: glycosyltransferase [Bacteroidota bacterium]
MEATSFENLSIINYKGFVKGLRYLPTSIQKYLIRAKFAELQKLCDVKFDVVWSFDNSVFYDYSALPKDVLCISHIVDLNQDFQFELASKSADLCLCTTSHILERQKKYNANSHNIGHGVNLKEVDVGSFELNGYNRVKCGYAGNLDIPFIDWTLVKNLVEKFSGVDFHFVGKWESRKEFRSLLSKPNFFYYGQLHANNLQSFYNAVDILLLTYLYQHFPQQLANPHKMMEYLASGRLVVATWTSEYEELHNNELIVMSKLKDVFFRDFKNVVDDLSFWNSDQKFKSRRLFAENNSYKIQIERIEKLIEDVV